jgi:DNA-binding transcriptional MocR family regulator
MYHVQARRKQLIRLARKHDAMIIADDVYDLIHWPTEWYARPGSVSIHITRIVDADTDEDGQGLPAEEFGNCVSNGSFSRMIGPGCRIKWAEATPKFIHGLSQA